MQTAQVIRNSKRTFYAVTVVDEEQVEVLKTILHTEKAAHGVTAIVLGGPNPAQKIPGEVGGVRSFRKGTITEFWTTGVTCPRPIGFSEARYNVKPKETVVMVARIYERFMPATLWNDAKDTPQRFVHRWFATQNLRAEDSWGWQLGELGLEEMKVTNFLDWSEFSGSTSPLCRRSLVTTLFSKRPGTIPLKNRVERLEKETDEEQVARARRIGTSLGGVMSRTQLGYRVSGKSTQPLPRMWLFEAFPKTWDVDSVKAMLEQHFHQVSQRRRKGDSDFFFETVAKTDVDLVSLPVEEDGAPMLYCARWAPVRKVPAQCKQVRQVIAWNLRAENSTKVEVQAATATPAVDEKGKPVFAPRRRVINARAVPDDVEVAQAPRDGSCLYHAFAQAAGTMYDMKLDPLTLRAEVVITHRAKHADRYIPIWCGEAPDGSRLWNDKQTAEEIQEALFRSQV